MMKIFFPQTSQQHYYYYILVTLMIETRERTQCVKCTVARLIIRSAQSQLMNPIGRKGGAEKKLSSLWRFSVIGSRTPYPWYARIDRHMRVLASITVFIKPRWTAEGKSGSNSWCFAGCRGGEEGRGGEEASGFRTCVSSGNLERNFRRLIGHHPFVRRYLENCVGFVEGQRTGR